MGEQQQLIDYLSNDPTLCDTLMRVFAQLYTDPKKVADTQ